MNSFLSGFLAMFIAILMFTTVPAYAISNSAYTATLNFADETPVPTLFGETGAGTTATPATTTTSTTNTATTNSSETSSAGSSVGEPCEITKLDSKEAANIMDLTKQGYQGKEMTDGGTDTNDGKTLGDVQLVGNTNDGKTGIKVDAPSEITPADRFAFLANKTITGPWGVGLIMDDTLRVGRCEGLPQEQCRINGDGLSYRTGGTGIKSDFSSALDSFKDTTTKTVTDLSDDEYEGIKNNILDVNQPNFTVAKWDKEEQIKNSILTFKYNARNATNCNNNTCVVSTYSAFDKYYNAWFSSEMVVSSFGPMAVHGAGKLFNKLSYNLTKDNFTSPVGKLINKSKNLTEKLRGSVLDVPSKIIGKRRIDQYQELLKTEGLEPYIRDLTVGKKLFSTGAQGFVGDVLKDGSDWSKLPLPKKQKLFEAIEHLRDYTQGSKAILAKASDDLSTYATRGITRAQAELDYATIMSKQIVDWDDATNLDFIDWIKDKDELVHLKGIAAHQTGAPATEGFNELSTGSAFNFKSVLQKFNNDGTFAGDWTTNVRFDSTGDALKIFKLEPSRVVQSNVAIDDLYKHVAQYGEGTLSVRIPGVANPLPLNSASIKSIVANPAVGGNIDILDSVWTEVPGGMSPADLANRLSATRISGRVNAAEINLNDLYMGMREKGYSKRTSFNLLDSQFAKENKLITDYFKRPLTAGLYTGTLLPIGYWNLKRGAGFEEYSAYMLPDSWTSLDITHGVDDIYKDSYTDFYANEGSDQGDLFARVINSNLFLWQKIVDAAVEKGIPTLKETYDKYTGESGLGSASIMRDEVKDLALYTHNEDCAGCSVPITFADGYFSINGFRASSSLQMFLVEAASEKEKIETGSTIVAYGHHTDLKGKSVGSEGEPISLVTARLEGKTCDQKLREIGLGWAGSASGGVLALTESMAYAFGIGPGLMATGIQQLMLAPELQDCVDDKEGYYVHFYSPPQKEADSKKSQEVISNETVSDAFSKMADGLDTTISSNNENLVTKSMDKIKDQFKTFSNEAKAANILQANLNVLPPNSGTLTGKELFYFWYKGNAMPSGYDTTSKTVMTDGNTTVEINKEAGVIKVNGKTIVSDEDLVRMSIDTGDLRIPAQVVPYTLTKVAAPNTSGIVFELNTNGEIFIKNAEVLKCIQSAVKAQSGIEYSGDELTQVFGELSGIRTSTYGSVFVQDGKIMLEGTGPRAQGGASSRFVIDGYWESVLKDNGVDYNAGKFIAMTFKHGTIVLKEETNQLIVWLRQHKDAVLSNKDVTGLKAKLTTVKDPETECDTPAIDLEAMPFPNDQLGQSRVDNFNASMEHLGPFTQFTTDSKIFIFYSKLDETGACKDFFKVIDKETGKVLTDQEIVGGVKQLEDGTLQFKTADGKNHELKFDAENGVPKVSYNGQPPETLRTAQGPNGSFWYDPDTGLWYPENGMQIPMNQSYKDNGGYFSTEDGKFSGQAGNPMTFNIGSQQGGAFSVPSMPETALGMILFISLFLAISFITTRKPFKKKRK